MLARIGRSAYQLSRASTNKAALTGSYGLRSAVRNSNFSAGDGFASCENGGFGFLRSYCTSIAAGKQAAGRHIRKDFDPVFRNLGLRRLFCSNAQKTKKYDNYRPVKKSEIPKANNQTSGAKGDKGTGERRINVDMSPALLISLVLASLFLSHLPTVHEQISFQEFKNKLLEPGLVDHIVVSNKSVAKVFVKISSPNNGHAEADTFQGKSNDVDTTKNMSQYKYYFNIGSVESFEEKLSEAQESLGIDPHNYIPVTYASDVNLFQELLKLSPTLLLLATLIYMGRRSGLGAGSPGGKGGLGIFNMGFV